MLIWIASRPAVVPKEVVILDIRDSIYSHSSAHLKPLGTFPPMMKLYVRTHATAVTATPISGGFIIRVNKAVIRIYKILVNCLEVIDRDAALRKKDKSLI